MSAERDEGAVQPTDDTWVVPVSSLTAEQQRALRKTLPPPDTKVVPVGAYDFYLDTATGLFLALGFLALLSVLSEGPEGLGAVLIFWVIALFGTGRFERTAPVKQDNVAVAREFLKAVKDGDADTTDVDLHFQRHDSGQISATIPSLGAQWTLVGSEKHRAQIALLRDASRALGKPPPTHGLPAADRWSEQWLAGRPEVQRRAGTDSTRISSLMGEVAALIDTNVSYENDDMMRLLETMRTDCDESVALYLELTPDEASRPLRSGKTATAELITLLELINTKATQMRADGVLATGDNLSFLRRLSEQRFTRSDLDLT